MKLPKHLEKFFRTQSRLVRQANKAWAKGANARRMKTSLKYYKREDRLDKLAYRIYLITKELKFNENSN